MNVHCFGVKGDGCTDDTDALQRALDDPDGGDIHLPTGLYKLSAKLHRTGNCSIVGESRGKSQLWWQGSSAGVGVSLPLDGGFSSVCSIQNVSFLTSGSVDEAININGSPSICADRVTPRVVLRDLIIRGKVNPMVDGFSSGIHLTNCSNAVIDSVAVTGRVSTEPSYDSLYGIVYDSGGGSPHPSAVTITNSIVSYAKTGIYCSDFEGGLITNNQIVGVNTGITVSGPDNYPHASILNNHINASETGVVIDRMYEVFVHSNLIYKQLDNTRPGCGVNVINGASFFSIQGNTFENLNAYVGMNAVIVSNGGYGIASGNIFRRCNSTSGHPGVGIWLTSGAHGVMAGPNLYFATANNVIDSGTLNRLI